MELDAHAGSALVFLLADPGYAARDLDRGLQVGDPKVELHEGADLGGRVGLDEDATLVDVGRELTEERVDSAVVDADL